MRVELLMVRCVYHLLDCTPHCYLIRQIRRQSTIEVGRACLKVGSQSTILHGKIIVFLLVHLLVDDVLLCDP